MTRRLLFAARAVALLAAACGPARDEAASPEEAVASAPEREASGDLVVTLSAEGLSRVALQVAALPSVQHASGAVAWGRLLDPLPLVSQSGELSSAEAALAASRAEFDRVSTLQAEGGNASRRAVEAAGAQLRTDEARLAVARGQLRLAWGEAIAALPAADRASLAERMIAGQEAIARVSMPAGPATVAHPAGASVALLGDGRAPLPATAVLQAPAVDPTSLGPTFLLQLAARDAPLRPGAAVTARLDDGRPARAGVIVPAGAVVQAAGAAWIFVRRDDTSFVRRQIALDEPTPEGWFVGHPQSGAAGGLEAGAQVVVVGAQALLSEALKSAIPGED